MKEALRRDWEQTRNDLSGGRAGKDLNQNLDDTVAQAAGNRTIPPRDTPNPLDGPELARKVENAQRAMRAAERTFETESHDAARRLVPDWSTAERPVRFGYSAALHYGGRWSPEAEGRIRSEWTDLDPDTDWEQVRDEVKFAWERAAANRHS